MCLHKNFRKVRLKRKTNQESEQRNKPSKQKTALKK